MKSEGDPRADQTLLTHPGERLRLVLGRGPFTRLWGRLPAELNGPRHHRLEPPVGVPADGEETATFQAPGWRGHLAASSSRRAAQLQQASAAAEG